MILLKKAEIIREFKDLYRLRYKVYSPDQHSIDSAHYPDKIEKDNFDAYSVHFIAMDPNREIIGTLRLINDSETPGGLPIKSHPGLFSQDLSTLRCAEVSRFAVDPKYRHEVIFLGLLRILYQYCQQKKISSLLFAIEMKIFQFLENYGAKLKPVGKADFYLNRYTMPVRWDFSDIQGSLRVKNPQFYQWLQKDAKVVSNENALMDILKPASYSAYNYMTIARG